MFLYCESLNLAIEMKSQTIKVTSANFATLSSEEKIGDSDKPSFGNMPIDLDDYFAYQAAVPKLIKEGKVYVYLEEVGFNFIRANYCIKDGGRGDSDGYGVEPDTWITAYLNSNEKFVSPLALSDSKINRNISNLLVAGIDPENVDGSIKICPFDKVEKDFRIPDYFKVLKDNDWGFADSKLIDVIPPTYEYIHGDQNGLIWVRLHNRLCGILDLNNQWVLPPIYEFISCIDEGEFKGNYKVKLNGIECVVDRNNTSIWGNELKNSWQKE
jgi:hypothetical protein